MKRNLLSILVALLPLVASATTVQNTFIYVTGANGKAGNVAELTLNLHNIYPISSWKYDLILPEGVTFKSITPIKDRFPEGYDAEVTASLKESGSVSILWKGTENIGLNGNDGAIAIVKVDIDDTVTSGKYMVTLQEIFLMECNGNIRHKDYTEFKWPIMGNSYPFVEEGKVWNMLYNNEEAYLYPSYQYRYYIEGDTLISSLNCKKLYAFNENNDNQTEYKMALHESGGKVYFIPSGSTESYLLYDFQIPEGESVVTADNIHPEWEIDMRNNGDRLIEINDVSRHCLFVNRVNASFEYPSGWWIEGIGSELGPLNTWGFEAAGNSRYFVNCEVNGQEIFNFSDFYSELKGPDYDSTQKYFPDGTKWTEIRLDTLKFNSWYSKIGDEWVPNFETIEYRVQGEYDGEGNPYSNDPYKCVYTNSSEWTDSLTLLISEGELNGLPTGVLVTVYDNEIDRPLVPSSYPFEWEVGTMIRFKDILAANMTALFPRDLFDFGVVEEINEAYFGGVRLLKYSDVKGVRMIQGIGVATWNDGECIFGPLKPYDALPLPHEESRHYRSMLVHFERDGEVLYDVWPEKEATTPVTFTKDQMATIILPTAPDAGKGKYYRLDKCEDGKIIFEQEKQPQAHIPYIIVPSEDFSIDTSTLDLAGLHPDTVSIAGISFIGSYSREEPVCQEGWYIDIIDTTPDCGFAPLGETGKGAFIGALRAYLTVNWDDPINHSGSKGPGDKLEIVLKDNGTSLTPYPSPVREGSIYDLQGRKLSDKPERGIYIEDGKKKALPK